MTVVTNAAVQNSNGMHNLYYALRKPSVGGKTDSFSLEAKNEDAEVKSSDTSASYATNNEIYEQMNCNSKQISANRDSNVGDSGTITESVMQVNEWPSEDSLDPAFITFNKGLTGYDRVEYFYDLTSDGENPKMYMRTLSGNEEKYYKLDVNSINPATATKAELLGYYSYHEYNGEDVNTMQIMVDMEMAKHNGDISKSNLQEAFLKYRDNWLTALQNVFNIKNKAGDTKGATATQKLLDLMNINQ